MEIFEAAHNTTGIRSTKNRKKISISPIFLLPCIYLNIDDPTGDPTTTSQLLYTR
jgi:hypothetical protein